MPSRQTKKRTTNNVLDLARASYRAELDGFATRNRPKQSLKRSGLLKDNVRYSQIKSPERARSEKRVRLIRTGRLSIRRGHSTVPWNAIKPPVHVQ